MSSKRLAIILTNQQPLNITNKLTDNMDGETGSVCAFPLEVQWAAVRIQRLFTRDPPQSFIPAFFTTATQGHLYLGDSWPPAILFGLRLVAPQLQSPVRLSFNLSFNLSFISFIYCGCFTAYN